MAASTSFDPFFTIYADPAANVAITQPQRDPVLLNLPGGGCHFVDLTPGASAARCGCRRFWIRAHVAPPRPFPDNSALSSDASVWCMCGHHACYHDDANSARTIEPATQVAPQPMDVSPPDQENERPRTIREPLSPFLEGPLRVLSLPKGATTGLNISNIGATTSLSTTRLDEFDAQLGDQQFATGQPDPSMPDTLSWGDLLQTQQSGATAPPSLAPPPVMPSRPSSTTSSQARIYLRPFAGKGLKTLGGNASGASEPVPEKEVMDVLKQAKKPKSRSFPMSPGGAVVGNWSGSLAVLKEKKKKEEEEENNNDEGQVRTLPVTAPVAALTSFDLAPSIGEFRDLSNIVQGHEKRIECLETVSFTTAHDDCGEKHDQTDLRVTDLEVRMEEVEKQLIDNNNNNNNNNNNSHQERQLEAFDESSCSVASGSTASTVATTVRTANTAELQLQLQLQALQNRVNQLQSVIPSFQAAWEVEVVFLPFPLRRLWQDSQEFRLNAADDEWTQVPNSLSAVGARDPSPFCGEWGDPLRCHDWLLPKAFAVRSLIDRRLRSRGLVRMISVKGPDARSVAVAIKSVFGNALESLGSMRMRHSTDQRADRFLGLRQAWVPLRKMHKDSRLRFLTPAEMLTPTVWDIPFLNSVVMRSSEPRLFVTQPEAYLQDSAAHGMGWTWQRLREMPRQSPQVPQVPQGSQGSRALRASRTSQSPLAVPEADAMEDCWAWSEQLDGGSGWSGSDRRRVSSSSHQESFFTTVSRSTSPAIAQVPVPASLKEQRRPTAPLYVRTTSMSPALPGQPSPANHRRRGSMNPPERKSSSPALRTTTSSSGIMKRRQTRSPSRAHFTPRWTASPSPAPYLHHRASVDRQGVPRGVTPLYYATPYSNAPPTEPRGGPSDGDARIYEDDPEDHREEEQEYDDDDRHADDRHADDRYADDDGSMQLYEDSDDKTGDGSDGYVEIDDDGDSILDTHVHVHSGPAGMIAPHNSQAGGGGGGGGWTLPEDEPWPGIEDQMSDMENVDPNIEVDRRSDVSSQPSEYPSTQHAWHPPGNYGNVGFHIHEDDE